MSSEETVRSDTGPVCPYCGHVHSDAEGWREVVTFWGSEDGPVEYDCDACDLSFKVNEVVTRSWESSAMIQKAARKV